MLNIFLQIVDTPGFGDSDGSDNKLIQEMMDILDNTLGSIVNFLTPPNVIPLFTLKEMPM